MLGTFESNTCIEA